MNKGSPFSSILQCVGINSKLVDNVEITGKDPVLPTTFLIGEATAAAIAAVGYSSSELWKLKTGSLEKVSISVSDAGLAGRSHQFLRFIDRLTPELWDPLSGFYQTLDNRYIQLHCNFPNHRQGVLDILKCDSTRTAVEECISKHWTGEKIEYKLNENGLACSFVRTIEEWQNHKQYHAISKLPLIEIIKIGESNKESLPNGDMPLSGIKMLDLSRVIAGPICGKTMSEHGATVMLVTSPNLPSIEPLVVDTGFGKLSAHIDLNTKNGKLLLDELVLSCDVFLQAYRPGGLDINLNIS